MAEKIWTHSGDSHFLEPADLWQSRLPAKYKDEGPRIVIAPQGEIKLVEGAWVETPGTGDKMAAWWHYEDHRYQLKQVIACPGMKPEEVTSQGVTYDERAFRSTDVQQFVLDASAGF